MNPYVAYRFTEADEESISSALRRQYRGERLTAERRAELLIAGAKAIGCTARDLREVEVQWIFNEIGEIEFGI